MEVIVKIIKQNPWTGLIKWSNCTDVIGTYYKRSGVRYTGLTDEEARSFEQRFGYKEGTLAPESTYWDTFGVKISVKGTTINTDTLEGEFQYKFLKNHKFVADGVSNITPQKNWVIINKEAEAEQANKANKVKREAYRAFDKMTLEEMRKCLRIFGIKSDNLSNELVEAKMNEQIDKDPSKFIRLWVENPNKEMNFLVESAISKNIIRKNRTAYYFGTDMIGNGLEDVIAYLSDKKNQDILLAIRNEAKVK